jgi:predicted ATP-dependent endonuclease of OLD family
MEDVFVKNITINNVRNIKNFSIMLSDERKLNLILTGKNGSGKTSLLNELKSFLGHVIDGSYDTYEIRTDMLRNLEENKIKLLNDIISNERKLLDIEVQIVEHQGWISRFGGVKIDFNGKSHIHNLFKNGNFIVAFFGAKRNTSLKVPTGINKVNTQPTYKIDEQAGKDFIQYIVNLKADRSFAKDDNDIATVSAIDKWFIEFEKSFFDLFDNKKIKLKFDRKSYNFNIVEDSKEPYNLNQLSDGYSAILNIVTELIMRMERHRTKSYDVQGIVLVDEIETHLHIDLQKKVLPFLTSFFPKIQFIVTTHSPFVLSSIENAIVCDLEKRIVTKDLTGYSYDTLIENYFNSDKYSNELKKSLAEYEQLNGKVSLTETEKERIIELKSYLNEIPKFLSDELAVKIQQIKLKYLKK